VYAIFWLSAKSENSLLCLITGKPFKLPVAYPEKIKVIVTTQNCTLTSALTMSYKPIVTPEGSAAFITSLSVFSESQQRFCRSGHLLFWLPACFRNPPSEEDNIVIGRIGYPDTVSAPHLGKQGPGT